MKHASSLPDQPQIEKIEKKNGCILSALSILGDKWSALLLGHLFANPKTFSELNSLLPGISPRTLSARLDDLEKSEIITKKIYCQRPPRYKYHLTKKGQDLRSILVQMANWGQKYN